MQLKSTLHESVIKGSIDEVKALIEKGADLNAIDKYGLTPLLYALQNNKSEIATLLRDGSNLYLI